MARGESLVGKRGRPSKEEMAKRAQLAKERAPIVRTDEELLAEVKNRFEMFRTLTEAVAAGDFPSMVVPGAPGIGKSYTVFDVMTQTGNKMVHVNSRITAVELYKLSWQHRRRGDLIFLDDVDSVWNDENSMNLIKAMTDSSKERDVCWMSGAKTLADNDVDTSHIFNGSVIFCTNKDFQKYIDEKHGKWADHMSAIMSRTLYLDLLVHDRRSLSLWINHVCWEGKMFQKEDVSDATGKEILAWLHGHQDRLREYSLRTVHKMCDLTKSPRTKDRWQSFAQATLVRP